MPDGVMGNVMDGVCDGVCGRVCDRQRLSQRLSQAEGVMEVWLFGKDSFEEYPLTTIMVVVNSVTKQSHFVSTVTTLSAARTAQLYLQHIWKHHGLPKKVVSDRGPQSIAEFTKELYWILRIKLAATTVYHLQGDGQIEQVCQRTLCRRLPYAYTLHLALP